MERLCRMLCHLELPVSFNWSVSQMGFPLTDKKMVTTRDNTVSQVY
jgi:hypothetical protein